MPTGGARVRSSSVPRFDALNRQRDGKEWTKLPRECTRPAPEWPLIIEDPTMAELAMWAEMWAMPQAHIWHMDHMVLQVGAYVRNYVESVKPNASSQKRINARQSANDLLLTTSALHSARYVITGSPEEVMLSATLADHSATGGNASRQSSGSRGDSSARSRMQVVPTLVEPPADDEQIEDEPVSDPEDTE